MLLKRILIGVLCAVITGGAISYGVQFRFFDKPLTAKEQDAFEQRINLPDGFVLAASSECSNAVRNSMESVDLGVKSSSYAIELNIAFDKDNVPYLAQGDEYITEKSVKLESVFKKYTKQKYLRYILHLTNKRDGAVLYALSMDYECTDKILLTGFNKEDILQYGELYPAFPIAMNLDTSSTDLHNVESCFDLAIDCSSNGASMALATPDQITDELIQGFGGGSIMPLAIRDVQSEYDMYKALSARPSMIITNKPDQLYSIMREGDFMGYNRGVGF